MTDPKYHVVARAVRMEIAENKDDVFVVFKVTDEQFKQHILSSWQEDVELLVIDKNLVKIEE